MKQVYQDRDLCTGCAACSASCPRKAIKMAESTEGFLYPEINEEKCVDCQLCVKVCPIGKGCNSKDDDEVKFYAAKNKNDEIRMDSASGGIFSILAQIVMEDNGVVYGAGFDKDLNVRHIRIDNVVDLGKLRGSKYVQSDIQNIYSLLKEDVKSGRKVLFSGTPCQIAGIRRFIGNADNLLLCDIVCHGVPSPSVYRNFINWFEKKENNSISRIVFRDKEVGWQKQKWKVIFENGKEEKDSKRLNVYKTIFYDHIALRRSCHHCEYTNVNRVGDITIGDFWGVEKTMPDFVDEKGISLIIVNTEKGKDIFESVRLRAEVRETIKENCLQPQLKYPTQKSKYRESFLQNNKRNGFNYAINKYLIISKLGRVKRKCLQLLRR